MSLKGITRSKEVIPKGIAEELHIGIVRTQWNKPIIDELHRGCREKLEACGVKSANIREMEVPGAFELPYAADLMKRTCPELRAIICIGCLIKGETMHFEYIASAVSHGIMQVQIKQEIPVMFGVLTCVDEQQAEARAGLTENGSNHGDEWAISALQMTQLRNQLHD